jgi:hypothetical protein
MTTEARGEAHAKSIAKKVLRRVYSSFGSVRIGDLIPVDADGFWRSRSSPARSLKAAAALFNQLNGETIVEIGSGLHGRMSGNSIMVWSRRTCARTIIAIDLDPERIGQVRRATSRYPHVKTVVGDGMEFLEQFPGSIDLLYLDFWTPDPDGAVPGTGRAEAYRRVYRVAKDKMTPHSMILIDDTDHIPPWKHTLMIPDARHDGFVVLYTGRQTLLKR